MTKPLTILVVDDTPADVAQLEAVARQLGHAVIVAGDGIEAIEKYRSASPDLIFMDILMPGLDGIEAARQVRALPCDRWVPIVFFAAPDSMAGILRGLEAGGDDYLVKPPDLQVIRAKIKAYARALTLQDESRRYARELAAWRDDAEEQSQLGQYIIGRLLDSAGLRDPMVQWLNTPAQSFSGDLVCASRGPGDILYLMLADAAGHGLSAALTALPLTQVFHGMVAKGFPIHTIAEELNGKLKAFLPIDRFVAASLVALDTRNQTIEIWNGGNPDVLFINDQGEVAMRWPSRHPPLGILPPALFSGATEVVSYQHPGEMVLFSDGIIEAENPDGQRLNMHGLEALLAQAPSGERLPAIEAGVARQLAGRREHDDLSAIVVKVPIERRQTVRSSQAASAPDRHVSEWRMELSWGPEELRSMDVVPALLGFMGQIKGLQTHQGQLFLILAELFNNALDHGVLGLDSRTKSLDGGFERYLEEREGHLNDLRDGRIDMAFHRHLHDGRTVLDIRIKDSGVGFDWSAFLDSSNDDQGLYQTHGRGIRLVRNLCQELSYGDNGSAVFARYAL
ncbi:MAG: fused response regulator/phosphatase [Gallionellaceae bacterium]|nr:fused response regulator/phosphatase [Gallionellaceae bacterium]